MEYQEQIIRKVSEIGNGAHVFAPKEWLNEPVLIVRISKKNVHEEIISLLSPYLDKIIAVFLYGSHARGEETENSDVDLFIISREKFEIKEKEKFDIIIVPENKLRKAKELNPILFYSMLSEAKPIVNSLYLENLKKEKINPGLFKNFFQETKRMIKINKEMTELDRISGKASSESTIYSLILRLRGIFIIKKLLLKERFSNKEFRNWIVKNCNIKYEKIYAIYRDVRDGKSPKCHALIKEAEAMIFLIEKEFKHLSNRISND